MNFATNESQRWNPNSKRLSVSPKRNQSNTNKNRKKMKRFATIIAVCLLISASAFSQTKFPAVIEFNGDTVVAITTAQMDTISERLIDCSRLASADSLIRAQTQENNVCRSLVHTQSEQIRDLTANNKDLDNISDLQGQIIHNKNLLITEQKKKNRKNLFIGVPVSFSVGLLVGFIPAIVRQF